MKQLNALIKTMNFAILKEISGLNNLKHLINNLNRVNLILIKKWNLKYNELKIEI